MTQIHYRNGFLRILHIAVAVYLLFAINYYYNTIKSTLTEYQREIASYMLILKDDEFYNISKNNLAKNNQEIAEKVKITISYHECIRDSLNRYPILKQKETPTFIKFPCMRSINSFTTVNGFSSFKDTLAWKNSEYNSLFFIKYSCGKWLSSILFFLIVVPILIYITFFLLSKLCCYIRSGFYQK